MKNNDYTAIRDALVRAVALSRDYTIRDAMADMLNNAQISMLGREIEPRAKPSWHQPKVMPAPRDKFRRLYDREQRDPDPIVVAFKTYSHEFDWHVRDWRQRKVIRRWQVHQAEVDHAYDNGVELLAKSLYPLEEDGEYYTELDPNFVHAGMSGVIPIGSLRVLGLAA